MNSAWFAPACVVSLVLLAVASADAQQMTVTAINTPRPEVQANSYPFGSAYDSLPLGVVGARRTITADWRSQFDFAYASLSVDPTPTSVSVGWLMFHSSGSSYSITSTEAKGAFDVDLVGPLQGSLAISYQLFATGTAELRVDVGADGVFEIARYGSFPQGENLVVPLSTTTPLRTRLFFRTTSSSGPFAFQGSSVSISYVPSNSVLIRASASGCLHAAQTPILSGLATTPPTGHRLDFRVENAFPNGQVALLFGLRTSYQLIALPPYACYFLVAPVHTAFLPVSAAGVANWGVDLSPQLYAATIHVQAIPFTLAPFVHASNRLDVVLVP